MTAFTRGRHVLANSLTTVTSDSDLYRLLTFHVPNLISLFHCLGRTEGSVRFRGFFRYFVTWLIFYGEELLAPRPTPKLEDHFLSAVRDCLFSIFAATLRIWRPFLQPQPEDAPCCGDKNSFIMGEEIMIENIFFLWFTFERALKRQHKANLYSVWTYNWGTV
jgi:hypothetical protein